MGRIGGGLLVVGAAVVGIACDLGQRSIGEIDVGDTAGGSGSGGVLGDGSTASSGDGDGSGTRDGPGSDDSTTVGICDADFDISGSVTFSIDPGPDGVGIVYVRATAGECMLGPSLGVWASPGIVDVREDVLNSDTMRVDFVLPSIACAEDGTPSVVRVAAFLDEGAQADPDDPTPRLGDMVNTVNGGGDVEGGYACLEVGPGTNEVVYDIDEFWFQ